MSKSVLFHPEEGVSASYPTWDEKPWYRISCVPVCVSLDTFVLEMDLTEIFRVV